jgi:hypothetical protein
MAFPSLANVREQIGTQKTPPRKSDGGVSSTWLISWCNYFLERFEALRGLIFCDVSAMLVLTWVARLQLPFFHLMVGSGQAEQYQPVAISRVRLQPLHCSTISWQTPSLYPQPLAVIKAHSMPLRTVVHFIDVTSQKEYLNK